MTIIVEGLFGSGQSVPDTGITDLEILPAGTGLTLYAHSGRYGGLTGYAISQGGAESVVDQVFYSTGWALGIGEAIALDTTQGGGIEALFGSVQTGSISAYALDETGQIGALGSYAGLGPGIGRLTDIDVGAGGIALAAADGTFAFATRAASGVIDRVTAVADTEASHLSWVTCVAAATVKGQKIVIAGDAGEDGITTFLTGTGVPVLADAAGPEDGIGIMDPTAIAVVEVLGESYAIVASAQGLNGALTVFHLSPDGTLTRADHITDNLATRFGGVTAVATVTHDGQVYLAAGGADDGISLFRVLPGGQLQFLDAIENTYSDGSSGQAALADVTAIAGGMIGDALHLFVAGEEVGGLTHLSYGLSGQGVQKQAAGASGGTLGGTAGDDVLVGGDGADTLSGGAGADILVDGGGMDVLTGGAGADVFVLRDDQLQDTILDFDPSVDRLDLSSWPFFYDPAALTVTSNANGAVVEWRGETLVLRASDNAPIGAAAVRAAVRVTPDRAMDLSGYVFLDWDGTLDEGPNIVYGYDIAGTDGDDHLIGGDGGEMITLSTGDDEVHAGAGDDRVDGGAGRKTVFLGDGDDIFDDKGGSGPGDGDVLRGGAGNDIFYMGMGDDDVDGGSGDDLIHAGAGNDTVTGGPGADRAYLGAGDDVYLDGDDHGPGDTDTVHGEGGNDVLTGGSGDDLLDGGDGDDRLGGRAGRDHLIGGAGSDYLWGADGNDILDGGSGDDFIFGGSGDDRFSGGDGNDRIDAGAGDDMGQGDGGDDVIYGGDGSDALLGGEGNDVLFGGAQDDRLWGDAGEDTLSGDAGDDRLHGGAGDDSLYGGAGNDRLHGNGHCDSLWGGDGDDTLMGGWSLDRLYGEAGNDTLIGGSGNDRLYGQDGNDNLAGDAGKDYLFGGAGTDQLRGGSGSDGLHGGSGNDWLYGEGDGDRMWGGSGNDWLSGGSGDDRLHGQAGADVLYGDGGNDRIWGGSGDDRLFGGAGNDELEGRHGRDRLEGNEGNDRLVGGRGNDILVGGAGRDRFVFGCWDGHDRILDFSLEDRLVLDGVAKGLVTVRQQQGSTFITWGDEGVELVDFTHGGFDKGDIVFV